MNTVDAVAGLSGQVIVDLTKKHTLFEWSAQGAIDPIPVAGAKGCWFWTPENKRFLAFYRSDHGGTAGAMMLTGDPRRWPSEPGMPGVIHLLNPYHGVQHGWETADAALARIEETIQLEGADKIAGFILEPVTGTNGVL